MLKPAEIWSILREIALDVADVSFTESLPQTWICKRNVQVTVYDFWHFRVFRNITSKRSLMYFGQGIVLRFAETKCFCQRRIEPVQKAQLELIRALLKVLEFTKGKRQVHDGFPRAGRQRRR